MIVRKRQRPPLVPQQALCPLHPPPSTHHPGRYGTICLTQLTTLAICPAAPSGLAVRSSAQARHRGQTPSRHVILKPDSDALRDRTSQVRPAPSRFEEEGAGGCVDPGTCRPRPRKGLRRRRQRGSPCGDGAAGAESFEGLGRDQTTRVSAGGRRRCDPSHLNQSSSTGNLVRPMANRVGRCRQALSAGRSLAQYPRTVVHPSEHNPLPPSVAQPNV